MWREKKGKQPCAAAAAAASAGKTKNDDKVKDKAPKVKWEVSKDDVNVGDSSSTFLHAPLIIS